MKTLILMRHTKAASPDPDQSDFDRPLASRGQRNAQALGGWLREKDIVPDLAIVSGAERTQQTWEALGFEADTPMKSVTELYDAAPSTYLTQLGRVDADTVLMIGHNPTVGALADHLLRETDAPVELTAYPTGATMVITFDGDAWESATKQPGTLAHWAIPRQLPGQEQSDS